MANRPQTTRSWAQSADTGDISEPSTERPGGFQQGQDLDHDQVNWLLRELFEWVDYLDELFQRAEGAVDLAQSVIAGDNGAFSIPADDAADIVASFIHEGSGESTWTADELRAIARTVTNIVKARSGNVVEFQNDQGKPGDILARVLEASSYLDATDFVIRGGGSLLFLRENAPGNGQGSPGIELSKLRQIDDAKGIEILNENDQPLGTLVLGTIDANTVETIDLKGVDEVNPNGSGTIRFGKGSVGLKALNTPAARGKIDWDGNDYTITTGQYNLSSATRNNTGDVTVDLDGPIISGNREVFVARSSGPCTSYGTKVDDSTVQVQLGNRSGAVDDTFFLTIY